MAHYPQEDRLSRAYIPQSVLLSKAKTVPFYSSNEEALAAGLTEGMLYAEEAYPHTLRAVVIGYLHSSDGYLLVGSDGYDLIPFIY